MNFLKIDLRETPHDHYADALRYSLIATHEAKVYDGYILLHIRQKPRLIPSFIWNFILKQLLVINRFKV